LNVFSETEENYVTTSIKPRTEETI
jgi:hypothetical protein